MAHSHLQVPPFPAQGPGREFSIHAWECMSGRVSSLEASEPPRQALTCPESLNLSFPSVKWGWQSRNPPVRDQLGYAREFSAAPLTLMDVPKFTQCLLSS